jgi:CRP-like cAMP-binding protein
MSDQLSVLPVELIHRILDEIATFDILTDVCFVNKRLRAISLNYPRFRFDLTRSFDKKRQFDEHCTQLVHLSSQVVSLTLANDGDATMPVRIAYFLSQFMGIDAPFSNLRSLSLSHVDLGVWQSLKVRRSSFFALTSISISLIKREKYVTTLFVSTTLVELLSFSS